MLVFECPGALWLVAGDSGLDVVLRVADLGISLLPGFVVGLVQCCLLLWFVIWVCCVLWVLWCLLDLVLGWMLRFLIGFVGCCFRF